MKLRAAWVLPMDAPAIAGGAVTIEGNTITGAGDGR
jgi:hypothetical protein